MNVPGEPCDRRRPALRETLGSMVAMRRTLALLGVLAVAATMIHARASEDAPRRTRHRTEPAGTGTTRFVIAAAGDIACQNAPYGSGSPANCQYDDTARLIDGADLARVLLLGDNQYEVGAFAAYMSYFDPTWGRAKPNLAPAPGNHEYANDPSSRPRGYFRYFGDAVKGPDGLGYYSYDVGACPDDPCWHLISLNSELCFAREAAAPPPILPIPDRGTGCTRGSRRTSPTIPTRTTPAPSPTGTIRGSRSPRGAARRARWARSGGCCTRHEPTSC